MKSQIRLKFVDFWDNFVPEDSLFYKILSEKYDVVLSDNPDYVFFSVFGQEHLKYDCIKIFYTGENQSPDFNLCDYAIGFDHIDFGDRYFRFPNYLLYGDSFKLLCKRNILTDLSSKTDFCSFVVSNNNSSPERDLFFDKLSEYKEVSSGGRHRNNVGGPVSDKLEFQKKHKFAIAFENCSQPGYSTEKILEAFASHSIPIYWGDPLIDRTFNENAFINCHSFSSWNEVVERVKELDCDEDACLKVLNAPVFAPDTPSRDDIIEDLKKFLYHIFDQTASEAIRFNRFYWGRRYLELVRTREHAYMISPRGIAESIYKKTLWKWRRNNKLFWKIDRMLKRSWIKSEVRRGMT